MPTIHFRSWQAQLARVPSAIRQWRPFSTSADQAAADNAGASHAAAGHDGAGQAASHTGADPAPALPMGGVDRFAADIATTAWRLRARAATLPSDMRPVTRHVESLWDTLAQAGVEVDDHVNAPFDPGLALSVVAYQPTPGIDRERVVEAIRPSVYLRDRLIQAAEVIVGTPPPEEARPEGEEQAGEEAEHPQEERHAEKAVAEAAREESAAETPVETATDEIPMEDVAAAEVTAPGREEPQPHG